MKHSSLTGSFTVVCGSTVNSANPRKTYDSRGQSFHRVYPSIQRFVDGEPKMERVISRVQGHRMAPEQGELGLSQGAVD